MNKIIRTMHLMHEFLQKDEDGKIESRDRVLKDISVEIDAGSFVALLGHNGSGKSTLARHLNVLLQPTEGVVWIDGKDTKDPKETLVIRETAGMVFQNPDNQIIASVVEEDVGFGPENIGVPTDEIWKRVAKSLDSVGMSAYRYHSPNKLSGGQKQRVAIAGVMAMEPSCMILDEATAMLDPMGRKEVLEAVKTLNREKNVTVIMITHDMAEAALADRILVMDQGNIVIDGTPREVFTNVEELRRLRLAVPQITELAWELGAMGMPMPEAILDHNEFMTAIEKIMPVKSDQHGNQIFQNPVQAEEHHKKPVLQFENLNYIYGRNTSFEKKALNNINCMIEEGSFVGLIGHTGSGKSTLIQHMNGLLKPTEGRVYFHGQDIAEHAMSKKGLSFKVGLVFQYPEYQLFEVDVLSDVAFGPKNQGLSAEEAKQRAKEALQLVGLDESQYKKSPFELSGGQKRRVAIAGVIAMKPEVLVLDEPAAGLDPKSKQDIMEMIQKLYNETGMTVILSSHSMEDMALYARNLIVMNNGEIVREGTPQEVFKDYRYLETIGLSAPEMTYVMHDLFEKGYAVSTDILTVQDAAEEIYRLWRA